jgi:transposase-like protein
MTAALPALKDVLFVCCDGLNGLPDAVEAAWPKAIVQTCVVHLIRSSMKYVSWKDRKRAAALMRPIYTAVSELAAVKALDELRREFGKKAPGMIAAWERAWDRFTPFGHVRGSGVRDHRVIRVRAYAMAVSGSSSEGGSAALGGAAMAWSTLVRISVPM